jgi:anti-sigma regulatory factor (Ser/Thr protein kinase)
MLAGLGEFLELDAELLDDLKTAISEACNNVVLHAYSDGPGPLHLALEITPESFDVSVRDEGSGIQRVSPADNRMGVGLAVISALANRAEFQSAPGEGTEVKMSFDTHSLDLPTALVERPPAPPAPAELAGDIVATLAPASLLEEVMGRLVRAVAAGAHFAVDRFPALHALTRAISAHAAQDGGAAEVGFAIVGRPKRLELRVGPLPAGTSEDLFAGSTPSSLEPLLEELRSSRMGAGELLLATVVEPRR